jgi:type IV secretion system protein VirB10
MTTRTATPNRLILQPLDQIDPRRVLDEGALVAASHNGFPIVAQRKARKDSAGLLAGGGIALLLGGLTFWSMSGHRAPPRVLAPAPEQTTSLVRAAPQPVVPTATPRPLLMPSVLSVASPTIPASGPAPVVVFDSSAAPAVPTASAPVSGVPGSAAAKSPLSMGGNDNDQFAARVGDGSTEVATAQQMTNPSTTVTQGTLIPAVLETAIDTDLPGYVRAVVSRDVKSFDGSHVLIPRSSRLIGQYKSGLSAGQTRAYVIWSRLIRPDGASVALASPAVDFSGTSGLAGKVDGHFMKRFGAAALLTVIGGLSAIGNPSVVLSGGQSAASVAAQGTAQIPPTVRVAQGQPIRVFTARDLDFSTVTDAGQQP